MSSTNKIGTKMTNFFKETKNINKKLKVVKIFLKD